MRKKRKAKRNKKIEDHDEMLEFVHKFFHETFEEHKNCHSAIVLDELFKKLLHLNLSTLVFMIAIRKKEHIATLYREMHDISLEPLDCLIENPGLIVGVSEMFKLAVNEDALNYFIDLHENNVRST